MSPLSHPSSLSRILRRLPAVAAAVCALGLVQAGSALADYDAGHYAHGNLICGVSHSNGAYTIYATAPVVIPDVPNQWVASTTSCGTTPAARGTWSRPCRGSTSRPPATSSAPA